MPQSNEPSYHNSDAPIHCQGNPSDNPSDRAPEKPTIAVSACLLGVACRYDGGSKPSQAVCDFIKTHDVNVVRICPEAMGGLSVPHPAHEITYDAQGNRRVVDAQGNDSTKAFEGGARAACRSAQRKGCTHAIRPWWMAMVLRQSYCVTPVSSLLPKRILTKFLRVILIRALRDAAVRIIAYQAGVVTVEGAM